MFGHKVEITKAEKTGEELQVDGRKLHADEYLAIEEIGLAQGIPFAIGTSAPGGNACDASVFVLSFPPDKPTRLDGPVGDCSPITWKAKPDHIDLGTRPSPDQDGSQWTWSPGDGFREGPKLKFAADPNKGWNDLRDRTFQHPADIYSYGQISPDLSKLVGDQAKDYLTVVMGPGSAEYKGDLIVGTACQPHNCMDTGSLLIANLQTHHLFVAWKPDGGKIVVRPPVKEWPSDERGELRSWATRWK